MNFLNKKTVNHPINKKRWHRLTLMYKNMFPKHQKYLRALKPKGVD